MHEKIDQEEIKREICVFISDSVPEWVLRCYPASATHMRVFVPKTRSISSRSLIDNKPRDISRALARSLERALILAMRYYLASKFNARIKLNAIESKTCSFTRGKR
jgi:hypothetical protein